MDDLIGERLGNYQVQRLISQGGFARVYLGKHIYLETEAAIKILKEELSSEDQKEFLQEAKRCIKLKHDHVLPVLEFGIEDGKLPYLIMHYAPKGTLRDRYASGSRVQLSEIVSYVQQVASALDYIHARRPPLIHRDVKPENLLVGDDDEVMLGDFGIAVMAHHTGMIAGQKIRGTPLYMAPEQFRGQPCPASDQYSLAIVVYEWLCGHPPFVSRERDAVKQFLQLASMHVDMPPPSLQSAGIAASVERVVFRALVKNPADRFPDVQAFVTALEEAVRQAELDEKTLPRPNPRSTSSPIVVPTLPPTEYAYDLPKTVLPFHIYGDFAGEITCLALSPDGVYMASASTDNSVHIWEVATQSTVMKFRQHRERVIALAWKEDGKRIASLSTDNEVFAWDVLMGERAEQCTGYLGTARTAMWQSGGLRIAAVSDHDQDIIIWDVAIGKELATYNGHTRQVQSVIWACDGSFIASADSSSAIHVWNPANGSSIARFDGQFSGVSKVAWSPNGRQIAAAYGDTEVRVWDVASNRLLNTYQGHALWVDTLAWSPDGTRIASAGRDCSVQVWDARTGQNASAYLTHTNGITAVAWVQNGYALASAGKIDGIHVWDAPSRPNLFSYRQHTAAITALAVSSRGDLVASGDRNGAVHAWYYQDGEGYSENTVYAHEITALAWSSDDRHIGVGYSDGSVRIVIARSGSLLLLMPERHNSSITALSWPSSDTLITENLTGTMRWNYKTGDITVTERRQPRKARVSPVTSPDRQYEACVYRSNQVMITSTLAARVPLSYSGHTQEVSVLSWSPGSRYLTSASAGNVQVYSMDTQSVMLHHYLHTGAINALAWSPDSTLIASAGDDRVVHLLRIQ